MLIIYFWISIFIYMFIMIQCWEEFYFFDFVSISQILLFSFVLWVPFLIIFLILISFWLFGEIITCFIED